MYSVILGTCLIIAPVWSSCRPSLKIDAVYSTNVGYKEGHEPLPDQDCASTLVLPDTTATIFAGAVNQPTIAVNPKCPNHIVAAWGQAVSSSFAPETSAIGIAYSRNGGKSWHHTHVDFQFCNGGVGYRVGDPSLSYGPNGDRVYLAVAFQNIQTKAGTNIQAGINLYTSDDNGISWSNPTLITSSIESAEEPTGNFPLDSIPRVTANPNNCRYAYTVWQRSSPSFRAAQALISLTGNAGRTWSGPITLYNPAFDSQIVSNGILKDRGVASALAVVLPKEPSRAEYLNGDLLGLVTRFYATPNATDAQFQAGTSFPYANTKFDVAVVRSTDKGATWSKMATVIAPINSVGRVYPGGYTYNSQGRVSGGIGFPIISPPFSSSGISAAVNPENGYVYVVWQAGNASNKYLPQIYLATSRDGGNTWSAPVIASRTPLNAPNPQAFSAAVAVTENGDVGILYSDLRYTPNKDPNKTYVDNWLAIYREVKGAGSTGIGLDFKKEIRLSKDSYLAQNAPTSDDFIILAARPSIVAEGTNFYAIDVESFDGPFSPAVSIFKDPTAKINVLLDKNQRTAPIVSIVRASLNLSPRRR
jgi:hypothetical protein